MPDLQRDVQLFEHFSRQLVAVLESIPADRLRERPEMNHALWTAGHTLGGRAFLGQVCGAGDLGCGRYSDDFGVGSKPGEVPDVDKETLVADLKASNAAAVEAVKAMTDEQAAAESPMAQYGPLFATNAGMASYLLGVHEAEHLGQLKAWRRAIGLAPAETA